MPSYATILGCMLPVFGVMLLGALLRRTGALSEESDRSILRMVVNVFTPCLIFTEILGNPAATSGRLLWLAPLSGFFAIALGILLCWLAAPLFGLADSGRRRVFAFANGMYNYGYIPIPIALSLFDGGTLGVLFLVNVGVELALWTFGPILLAADGGKGAWKNIFNAPLYAILAGVAVSLAGAAHQVPPPLLKGLHMLGECAVPVALLMIGAVTLDFLEPRMSWKGSGTIAGAVLLRLGVLPVVLIGLAGMLQGDEMLQRVLVVQAAMPAAAFPIVLVRRNGGDVPTALRVLLATSFASLLVSPFWISRGLEWIAK
jgi:predicted permease